MRRLLVPAVAALSVSVPAVAAQAPQSQPLQAETLHAVLTFFAVDNSVPLDAHVVSRDQALGFVREKIVFTGAKGHRVPAYLSIPRIDKRARVVLLQHGGASSKESWWLPDGYEYGALLTRRLLEAGLAVLALDAQNHGERSYGIDYVPIPTMYFENRWWAAYRDMIIETTVDYRRMLQYLEGRSELDLTRVGSVGQSMGGVTSLYLAALEPRVCAVVAGAPALMEPWLYPLSPINLSPALTNAKVLVLAGAQDQLVTATNAAALKAALPGDGHELKMFESGHRLPKEYVDTALAWLTERLRE